MVTALPSFARCTRRVREPTPERLTLHERLLTQAMAEAAELRMLKASSGRRPYSVTINERLPELENMLKFAPWPRLSKW
ncbi:hypothetical protein [Sorangium sp. So ce426]